MRKFPLTTLHSILNIAGFENVNSVSNSLKEWPIIRSWTGGNHSHPGKLFWSEIARVGLTMTFNWGKLLSFDVEEGLSNRKSYGPQKFSNLQERITKGECELKFRSNSSTPDLDINFLVSILGVC